MLQTLTGGPRSGHDEETVAGSIDLSRLPLHRWRVTVLDSDDTPTGETVKVESGRVTWSYRPPDPVTGGRTASSTAAAEVRRRAELVVAGPTTVPLGSRRYRVEVEWKAPGGVWVPWFLGVFVPTLPPYAFDGTTVRYQLDLVDKAWLWMSTPLDEPLRVEVGENPVTWVVADLAATFGETSTAMPTSTFTLAEPRTFDPSDTPSRLAVYNSLLEAAAFDQLTVNEEGRAATFPLSDLATLTPEITYGPGAGKIKVQGGVDPLMERLPNVVRFVALQAPSLAEEGNGYRTVLNQSTGPSSIDAIGEQPPLVVEVDVDDQVQLDALAASEAQRYFAGGGLRFRGQIGLNPRHSNRDVVGLDHPELGLSGEWLVTEWSYPLGPMSGEGAVLMDVVFEQRVVVS